MAGGQAFGHLGRRVGWQAGRTTGRQAWMLAGMYMSTHARARGALTPASLAWRGTRGSSRASSCRHSDPSRRSTEHGIRDSRSMPMACAEGISGLSVGEQGLDDNALFGQCPTGTAPRQSPRVLKDVDGGNFQAVDGKKACTVWPSSLENWTLRERRGPTLDMCTRVCIDVGCYVSTVWAGYLLTA